MALCCFRQWVPSYAVEPGSRAQHSIRALVRLTIHDEREAEHNARLLDVVGVDAAVGTGTPGNCVFREPDCIGKLPPQ